MSRSVLPAFSLTDASRRARSFPGGRPALLCFVKADCPTCALSAPLIEAASHAFGAIADVWAISQDTDGGATFAARHHLSLPMLDEMRAKGDAIVDAVIAALTSA